VVDLLLFFVVVGLKVVGLCDGLAVVGCIVGLLDDGWPVGSLVVGLFDGLGVCALVVGEDVEVLLVCVLLIWLFCPIAGVARGPGVDLEVGAEVAGVLLGSISCSSFDGLSNVILKLNSNDIISPGWPYEELLPWSAKSIIETDEFVKVLLPFFTWRTFLIWCTLLRLILSAE
jgi:hypothetical protein